MLHHFFRFPLSHSKWLRNDRPQVRSTLKAKQMEMQGCSVHFVTMCECHGVQRGTCIHCVGFIWFLCCQLNTIGILFLWLLASCPVNKLSSAQLQEARSEAAVLTCRSSAATFLLAFLHILIGEPPGSGLGSPRPRRPRRSGQRTRQEHCPP